MQTSKINWFPGHMKKATDQIKARLDSVDFILQIVDARAINLTSNNEILSMVKNKPLLTIAIKNDLTDKPIIEKENFIAISIKQKNDKKKVVNHLDKLLASKIEKNKSKGLINYQFIGMVIGLPNIGKSSIINFLSGTSSLIVENRPGVTKKQNTKKINNNYYLIDTPGILFKRIDSLEDGIKLAILGNVSKNVLPLELVIKHHYFFLKENYLNALKNFFGKEIIDDDFELFINKVCTKYKFYLNSDENDLNRAYDKLFNIFCSNKICNFNFNE